MGLDGSERTGLGRKESGRIESGESVRKMGRWVGEDRNKEDGIREDRVRRVKDDSGQGGGGATNVGTAREVLGPAESRDTPAGQTFDHITRTMVGPVAQYVSIFT
ncbi:hypothetical protein CRD60_04375 [Bifidobacterium aemilianum]|uniref:Uncharacterized protein n=1 Tax=Bifidobacterium aemilianum TaxID=2493120 RepID=A0A366K7V1_9BIFI|nr:hypothetical protein CRD60_04375 [Bifidobacterium aemilianum]